VEFPRKKKNRLNALTRIGVRNALRVFLPRLQAPASCVALLLSATTRRNEQRASP